MVANSADISEKPTVTRGDTEKETPGSASLRAEVFDFASSAIKGFAHDVVKPLTGIKQIMSGKSGEEVDPPSAEQHKPGYIAGAMAGQALDFMVAQVITKKLGLGAKAATILTSGTLAALTPTQAGGLDLKERAENFTVGAGSMAAFGGASGALKSLGLKGTLARGVVREASAGAFAGLVSAQSGSLLKTGHFADASTTGESMLGWAATGAAFHAAGKGAGRLYDEAMPEVLSRAGKLEATTLKPEAGASREFVITSGKEALEDFKRSGDRGLSVQVRELLTDENGKVNLGERKSMLVQHLSAKEGEGRLLPGAKTADLLATCNPENLSEASQAKHVFGKAEGNVWLYTGKNNRLLLTASDVPVDVTNVNGYKQPFKLNRGETTVNVMSDLLVGDPGNMNSEQSKAALADFRRQLEETKKLRMDGVSMDFWWGLIEREKGNYNFDYYHQLTDEIIKAGLDITVVESFHQCGGNVGDTENIPVPAWVWKDIASKIGVVDWRAGMYKSEQGHYSPEYIQAWADKHAIDYYAGFMKALKESFAAKAPFISEINISLGPSGEMRFPSYNSHDFGVGYPTRGAMQASSDLAQADLKKFAVNRYGGIDGVAKAWNIPGLTVENIRPPDDVKLFYDTNAHVNTQYGRDLMDWYNGSLVNHAKLVLGTAQSIYGAPDSPFLGTPIGAKVPGVHWRMGWKEGDQVHLSDRSAEANAGLIQTSVTWGPDNAWGYQNILNMFKQLEPTKPGVGSPVIPSYTCLELADGQDGPNAQSLPHTAAIRFGQAAHAWGLPVDAENALSGTLYSGSNWDLMTGLLKTALDPENYYSKLTLLRMHDVVDNPVGREKVENLMNRIHAPVTNTTTVPTFKMPLPVYHVESTPPVAVNLQNLDFKLDPIPKPDQISAPPP
jgi:beta-amylase